jgi:hypothetical protein
MSIAQQIGRVSSNFETATRVGEFVALARLVMLAKGDPLQAAEIAEGRRLSSRVAEVFRKSAVTPESITTDSSLAEYTGTTAAFLESLRSVGAFDQMLLDMKQVPPRSRVASTTLNATAYSMAKLRPSQSRAWILPATHWRKRKSRRSSFRLWSCSRA